MGRSEVFVTAVVAAAAMVAPAGVSAHGWMAKPLARHMCNGADLKQSVYLGGGSGSGDKEVPLGGVPGFCGDPFMDKETHVDGVDHWTNFAALPCEPQETYQAGGILDTHIWIAANHGGFFTLDLCDSDEMSDTCFEKYPLVTESHNDPRWYIMEPICDGDLCANDVGYDVNWKLPEDVTCEHCILMWTYYTGHHCMFDCDAAVCDWYAEGRNEIVRPGEEAYLNPCDSMTPAFGEKPQIFRNCADIRIEAADGSTTPSTPTPAPADEEVDAPEPEEDEEVDAPEPEEVVEATIEEADAPEPATDTTTTMPPPPSPTGPTGFTTQTQPPPAADAPRPEDLGSEISGAGDSMHCSDEHVLYLLSEINERRENRGNEPLVCDDRATGVAVNWSEMMCDAGEVSSDLSDNCNLAFGSEDCIEVLNSRPTVEEYALRQLNWDKKKDLYILEELTAVGMGWYDCDGATYWTVLAAESAGGAAMPMAGSGGSMPMPAPGGTGTPTQGKGSAISKWLSYYSQD